MRRGFFFLFALLLLSVPSPYGWVRALVPTIPKKMKRSFVDGLVLDSKIVHLNGVAHPYNGSLVEDENEYVLFFRSDSPTDSGGFTTAIGRARLNKEFEHIENGPTWIDTGTKSAEDPRAIRVHDQLYIAYNDQLPIEFECRRMHLMHLGGEIVQFDEHIQRNEKNWTPFEYENNLHFVYSINPHKILKQSEAGLIHLSSKDEPLVYQFDWEKKYGIPRGGTPAKLVDGEYLSFFHSMWTHKKTGTRWYVMGAYRFESHPPFRITAISKKPVFFEGAYTTKPCHTAPKDARVLYPCGYVVDGDKIHVSCGENDCAIRIITLDKRRLFEEMVQVGRAR